MFSLLCYLMSSTVTVASPASPNVNSQLHWDIFIVFHINMVGNLQHLTMKFSTLFLPAQIFKMSSQLSLPTVWPPIIRVLTSTMHK